MAATSKRSGGSSGGATPPAGGVGGCETDRSIVVFLNSLGSKP